MLIPGLEKNIGTLLEKASERNSPKTAIHFDHENVKLSYRQLEEYVNRFANVLRDEGISIGEHVAVMLPNCPEFPLTWLALAKLGAVMVPINIRYQAADLEYVLNDSDASAMVIATEFASVFRQVWNKVPNIRKVFTVGQGESDLGPSLNELARNAHTEILSANTSLDTLINIQYTSGTTGFPKGCMLTHEYWLTLGKMASESLQEDDVFLCVTPFYYMDPQWELIMCLTIGCTMVLTRRYSPSHYMALVHKYQATVSWASMASWIYKQPESPVDKAHRLKFVFIGAFPPHLHRPFEERFNVRAREAYGMTEIGTGMFVPLEDSHMTGSGSVGKPPPFREVRIVDETGMDVPSGQVGELLIKGPGMFKGYYKKPKETAEAFDGEWFRTGDLFRQDERGYYYIVGRKKDMIRRSGDNISAVEIENLLTSHPKILSAAVLPVPDENRGEEVKAYIIPANGETPETIPPEEIISFCMQRIAEFKVPRYIKYTTEFPRTPSGKVQKHLLMAEKKDFTTGCYDRLRSESSAGIPNTNRKEPMR
jgi:crotonobetaine/carnitine-CoA ligase